MVDTMEPQPLRAPELTIARSQLQERFDKVKKWHEEQQERLHSIQELRQQKPQEDTCRKFGDQESHKNHLTSDEATLEDCEEPSVSSSAQKRLGAKTSKTDITFQRNEEKPIKTTVLATGTSFEELLVEKLSHQPQPESDALYKQTKRPFLKKGAGLKRYYSKTPQWMQNRKKTSPKRRNQQAMQVKKQQHLITKLRLQRLPYTDYQHGRNDDNESKRVFIAEDTVSSSNTQKYLIGSNMKDEKDASVPPFSCDSDFMKHYQELEKQQQVESVELAEFEMLEEAAENTSFISDCSLITDKTRNDKPVFKEKQTSTTDSDTSDPYNKDESSADKENSVEILEENLMTQSTQLQRLLEAVKIRHQVLLNRMAETKIPVNAEKELSVVEEEDNLESDLESLSDDSVVELPASLNGTNHSSSPIGASEDRDNSFNDIRSWRDSIHPDSSTVSEVEFDINVDNQPHQETSDREDLEVISKLPNLFDNKKEDRIIVEQLAQQNDAEEPKKKVAVGQGTIESKENSSDFPSTHDEIFLENASLAAERYNILKKTKELEDEIATFKKENELLILLRKQREQALQQLEKEGRELTNYKEEIKKSLEEEVNEGRRQLYRERQNFERYQKMKRNYPDKKEREVISALRQQVEKLQSDFKKLETKSSTECKRLKQRLSFVEKERDSLKITVKQLEAQRVELLTLLKESQEKKQQVKKAIISLSCDELPQTSIVKNKSEDEHSSEENQAKTLNENKKVGRKVVNYIAKNANESSLNREIQSKKTDGSSPSTTKNTTEIEYSQKKEESHKKESQNTDKKQTAATSKPIVESLDKISEEPTITVENPDESNNGSALATHVDPKKSILKKYQKVQFMDIPDQTSSAADTKEKDKEQMVEKTYSNGDREIIFPSGTRKHISADGLTITINFYNGDWKQVLPDQRVIYHYAETDTIQTIYPDGSEIIEFSNGQVESHLPNGTKHIVLPDGSKSTFYADGTKQTIKIDGTVINIYGNGTEVIEYPNGQSEIRSQEYKKRKYPDGTVKILYEDGREETRYSNGRMRIKGKDGDVILDIQLPEL